MQLRGGTGSGYSLAVPRGEPAGCRATDLSMRTAVMLVVVLLVGGAMFGTLTWFFRRLRRIEEDSFGPQGYESLRADVREAGAHLWKRLRGK
jgi:hypothetical protein